MSRDKIDKQMIETVARLEERFEHLMSNHLPHLQAKMDKIDDRMWAGGVAIITILAGILVTLLFK